MTAANISPGLGVDASGQPVIDPTKNVEQLVEAANQRQDDLRVADGRLRDIQIEHLKEIVRLEAGHTKELRVAETARIDAIRVVDVAAVQRAAEVAAEAVQTLAAQVPITAEAVRTSLAAALNPMLNDIAELRKVQYEQQGQKEAGDDPTVKALAEMRQFMIEAQSTKIQTSESNEGFLAATAARTARTAVLVSGFVGASSLIVTIIAIATKGKF